MTQRENKILVWGLVWVSLLMVVLYSPIGSPDLYSPSTSSLFVNKQGVNFKDLAIPVLKKATASNGAINVYSEKRNLSEAKHTSKNTYYNSPNSIVFPTIHNRSKGLNNNISPAFEGSSSPGVFSGKIGLLSTSSATQKSSLFTASNDISMLTGNNATRQGGTATNPLETTDPGGDPTGPPIPVSDGWVFLLVLAACYALVKKFFLK